MLNVILVKAGLPNHPSVTCALQEKRTLLWLGDSRESIVFSLASLFSECKQATTKCHPVSALPFEDYVSPMLVRSPFAFLLSIR